MAQSGGVVMDGRDIGTVVLPHAELKVFLTASVDERSKRRWLELKGNGLEMDLQELREQIKRRDYIDSNRAINPLRQADDAVFLDTSDLSIEQVAAAIIGLAVKRGAALP
jgi:cytidylate kinase